MIKKFKKAVISSILAAIVIFGAVVPMSSAATAPNSGVRTPDFVGGFNVSTNNQNDVTVNVDYDITKVELSDYNDSVIRTATSSDASIDPVASGQILTQVQFKNVLTGQYKVTVYAGTIKSSPYTFTVSFKTPEFKITWSLANKATIAVSNLTPGASVSLVNPGNSSIVYGTPGTADVDGKATFTNIQEVGYVSIIEDYIALGSIPFSRFFGYSSYRYIATNRLPSLNIVPSAQGDVHISNAIPNAEVRLFHVSSTVIDTNGSVTSDVYLTKIAPDTGIVDFTAAATEYGRYRVIEIGSGGSDRSQTFTIAPNAPTLALSSTETGLTITGALPNARINFYNSTIDQNFSRNADQNGTVTYNKMPGGLYTATQATQEDSCIPSLASNAVSVQKWVSRQLNAGWNTLSIPFALKAGTATLEAILGTNYALKNEAIVYDTANNAWVTITDANQDQYLSKPMTSLYINMLPSHNYEDDGVYANFIAATGITPPPVYHINAGWNLVGPSLLNIRDYASDFLSGNSFDVVPMLISPNGRGFVYTQNRNNENVTNTLGYWVYAKSGTNLIGQISTGVVNDYGNISSWVYNN